MPLSWGNLLTTLRSIEAEFYVGFSFYINGNTKEGRQSIFHISGGASNSFLPAVWLRKDNLLTVTAYLGQRTDFPIQYQYLEVDKWYKFEVEQVLIEEKV